jgi:hypothetical protein
MFFLLLISESFKKKLFKNEDNYVCADCKTNPSDWFSSFYFITLCSSCAGKLFNI